MVGVGKDGSGPGEAALGQRHRRLRGGLLLQGLDQDSFQAAHVDEVHLQGAAAGGVQALGGVALPQAQELVSLPDFGPGQRAIEQPLGELGYSGTLSAALALMPSGGLVV